jgi:hypothetical protein
LKSGIFSPLKIEFSLHSQALYKKYYITKSNAFQQFLRDAENLPDASPPKNPLKRCQILLSAPQILRLSLGGFAASITQTQAFDPKIFIFVTHL